jgi:hypothetical protein
MAMLKMNKALQCMAQCRLSMTMKMLQIVLLQVLLKMLRLTAQKVQD